MLELIKVLAMPISTSDLPSRSSKAPKMIGLSAAGKKPTNRRITKSPTAKKCSKR